MKSEISKNIFYLKGFFCHLKLRILQYFHLEFNQFDDMKTIKELL